MSGNGVDLASVYGLLREVALVVSKHDQRFDAIEARLHRIEATMATKAELAAVRTELQREIADGRQDVSSLRQTVIEYHGAVVGHGIHISDHEERIGRLERHSGLA